MRIRRPKSWLADHQLERVSGGARIGQGEGWVDWGRRQLPGDWRTDDQKLGDFKAWDDWNRANGLPGAFGEPPRLKGDETFLNPREVTQDNPFGVFPEELQGLRDLRDGPPDGSPHPTPWAVPRLDAFIKEAEENRDSLDVRSFGRPGYDPDQGLPPDADRRAEAPPETNAPDPAYTTASYVEPTYEESPAPPETEYAGDFGGSADSYEV